MALPDSCFIDSPDGTACNCTGPPPELPPKPNFCPTPTTTAEPSTTPNTTLTTEPPTNGTLPTGSSTEPSTTTNGTTYSTGLIIGCTFGAIIVIVLCVLVIWWLWKKGKFCFSPARGVGHKSESQECLPGNEEKEVELLNIKKGTVVLNPISSPPPPVPPAWPEPKRPPPKQLAPITNDLTPVEMSKAQETSASGTSEGRADSSKSNKRKTSGKRSNRISPEPSPRPVTAESKA